MNFFGLLFVLLAHFITGRGFLKLFKLDLPPLTTFCLSFILGVPLISFAPCILQLLNLPIDVFPVIIAISIITILFSIPLLINFKRPQFIKFIKPPIYEWPFIIVCAFFMLLSIWRAFYYPPYARDMLAGPELLAEFAVKEHTMVSSVFTIDLQSTNNYFKSPFITSLQIIYKLLVCNFGQIWLSLLAIPFWIWLYSIVRPKLHPIVAGFMMMFFITIPDLFSYSYVMLYDFSNMVFYFLGFYFLLRFIYEENSSFFMLAAFLFGLATYIRTETLWFVFLILPLLFMGMRRTKAPLAKIGIKAGILLLIPVLFYLICNNVFVRLFVPSPLNITDQVERGLRDISVLTDRLAGMCNHLIFTKEATGIFGYYIMCFVAVLLLDLVGFRKFSRESRNLFYGMAVVFFGLALLGYLLPLVDLYNTTKRGLFKLLPMILFYYTDSKSLQFLSGWLYKLEVKTENASELPKVNMPKQKVSGKVKK